MFLLLFFVLIIQVFTYWIFEPITSYLTHILEIIKLPVIGLVGFVWLFAAKNN